MDGLVVSIPAPSERQQLFFSDHHKYVAFGGARGGGKSWSIRVKSILLTLAHAGIRVMIVRRNYSELEENHIIPLMQLLPRESYRYNDSKKRLTLCNGSVILFRHLNNKNDLIKYQGVECDIMFIDEATQFTYEEFRFMTAAIRGVNNFPHRIYLTCNPGGVGHAWVKRLFIDRAYLDNEKPEEYSFIQSKLVDNKILMKSDPDYVSFLESLPPKKRKAWLDGDWNIYDGQFFEEFLNNPSHYQDRRWTHVIDPFDIPKSWTIYRSFDWGYAKPFSCGWWAVDHDGVAYRIEELYGCTGEPNEGRRWTPDKVFAEIHRKEIEHPQLKGRDIIGVADPAIWASDTGESVEESAVRHGVYFTRADNTRLAGWAQVHQRMALDHNGYPMLYVFTNCKAFIRTIPELVYDDTIVEDLDTDGEDHVADETRYFCMARPIAPRQARKPDPFLANPAHIYLDIRKEDL